jgi:abhydrolase domain-containing protein 12
MVSSGASDKIFVLAFDYRGFGKSTGFPTEDGLIIDAISVIKWAMDTAKVSPDRIVLVAQSLGTGLASGAAAHFASAEPRIEFAGIVLCATFTEASTVFLNFSLKGWIPLLAPLKFSPWLRSWFTKRIRDTWKTSDRLVALVKRSQRLRLTLVHAITDQVIPWRNCNELFFATVNAASQNRLTRSDIDENKESVDLDEGGWFNTWIEGDIIIRQNVVLHGGEIAFLENFVVILT